MTIFYSDMEPLSHYFPVKLHRSPATRFLSENPDIYISYIGPFSIVGYFYESHCTNYIFWQAYRAV